MICVEAVAIEGGHAVNLPRTSVAGTTNRPSGKAPLGLLPVSQEGQCALIPSRGDHLNTETFARASAAAAVLVPCRVCRLMDRTSRSQLSGALWIEAVGKIRVRCPSRGGAHLSKETTNAPRPPKRDLSTYGKSCPEPIAADRSSPAGTGCGVLPRHGGRSRAAATLNRRGGERPPPNTETGSNTVRKARSEPCGMLVLSPASGLKLRLRSGRKRSWVANTERSAFGPSGEGRRRSDTGFRGGNTARVACPDTETGLNWQLGIVLSPPPFALTEGMR